MFGKNKGRQPEAIVPVELEAYVPELDFPAPMAEDIGLHPVDDPQAEATPVDRPQEPTGDLVCQGVFLGASAFILIDSILYYKGHISKFEYISEITFSGASYLGLEIGLAGYRRRKAKHGTEEGRDQS